MWRYTLIIMLLTSVQAFAMNTPIENALENPKEVGSGKFTYYFWDVYTVTLYAPDGKWDKSGSFALKMDYLRDFEGEKIAQRSIDEIKNQGMSDADTLATWRQQMVDIFPDVEDGDSLTGLVTQQRATRFYHNGELIGEIDDQAFSEHFFNIWLSENTSEPDLRDKLLGSSE